RDDLVTRLQARALCGPAVRQLADDWLQLRRLAHQSERTQIIAVQVSRRQHGKVDLTPVDVAAGTANLYRDDGFLNGPLQQYPARVLPCGNRLVVNLDQRIADFEAGRVRGRALRRLADHRPEAWHAVDEQQPVERDGQQKIGGRARENDGEAAPDRLAVECPRQLLGCYLTFALVQHLDVTAERENGNDPFGRIAAHSPGPHWFPESERETQHFHAAGVSHSVVAEFMDYDQAA